MEAFVGELHSRYINGFKEKLTLEKFFFPQGHAQPVESEYPNGPLPPYLTSYSFGDSTGTNQIRTVFDPKKHGLDEEAFLKFLEAGKSDRVYLAMLFNVVVMMSPTLDCDGRVLFRGIRPASKEKLKSDFSERIRQLDEEEFAGLEDEKWFTPRSIVSTSWDEQISLNKFTSVNNNNTACCILQFQLPKNFPALSIQRVSSYREREALLPFLLEDGYVRYKVKRLTGKNCTLSGQTVQFTPFSLVPEYVKGNGFWDILKRMQELTEQYLPHLKEEEDVDQRFDVTALKNMLPRLKEVKHFAIEINKKLQLATNGRLVEPWPSVREGDHHLTFECPNGVSGVECTLSSQQENPQPEEVKQGIIEQPPSPQQKFHRHLQFVGEKNEFVYITQ